MIASQEEMTGMCQAWRESLLNHTCLHCKFFEHAQGALGLIEVVYLVLNDGP